MKLFHFYRNQDHSGVSGTGPVVEGVQFTNGWCAIRWLSTMSSICLYQSLEDVRKVHGHGGKTEIILHDFEPITWRKHRSPDEIRFEILNGIIDEAARISAYAEDLAGFQKELRQSIDQIKTFLNELESTLSLRMSRSA